MSDGDNATPGLPGPFGPSDPGAENQWLTRTPRPSPGAAPWERGAGFESEDTEADKPTGNHTDGVTVADLIAKVHGDASVPEELKRPRAEPEPEPAPPLPAQPTEIIEAVREPVASEPFAPAYADPATEVIPAVPTPSPELPDLTLVRRRGRVPSSRVGSGRRAGRRKSHRGAAGRWSPVVRSPP